jgi:hypothetical protein
MNGVPEPRPKGWPAWVSGAGACCCPVGCPARWSCEALMTGRLVTRARELRFEGARGHMSGRRGGLPGRYRAVHSKLLVDCRGGR